MNPANDRSMSRWPDVRKAISCVKPSKVEISPTPQQTIVVNGLQLTSGYNRLGEALTQATMVADGVDEAWCYGVGLGELPTLMLARCKTLHVVIMNTGIAHASFSAVRHAWLDSPHVQLHLASELDQVYGPFAVSPLELRQADADAGQVRDGINTILNADLNVKMRAARRQTELSHLSDNYYALSSDACVSSLFGKYSNAAIVIMGGPTLDNYYGWIRDRRSTHTVIAASTALKSLLQEGIIPDYTCVIDSSPAMVKHFEVMPIGDSGLVYAPTIHPQIVKGWRGPRYSCDIEPESADLFVGGSVLFTGLDLAVQMGSHDITLIGADLCFPHGKSHVDGATMSFDVSQDWRPFTTNGLGEQVKTEEALMQYRQGLERYVKMHEEVNFYKLGRAGVSIDGVEWID